MASQRNTVLIFGVALSFVAGLVIAAFVLPLYSAMEPMEMSQQQDISEPAVYTCPMHPHINEDHEGDCPICGMDLVQRTPPAQIESLIYTCPMHPHINEDHEADCPICGMDLVLREQPEEGDSEGLVKIDSVMINNLGIKTTRVDRGTLYDEIRLHGEVYQASAGALQSLVSPYTGRVISRADIKAGERVSVGTELLVVESEEWAPHQEQLIAAVAKGDKMSLIQMQRLLKTFGFSEQDRMAMMEKTSVDSMFTLHAPNDVTLKSALPNINAPIYAKQSVVEFKERYPVIVHADITEGLWNSVQAGVPATMTIRSVPGEVWEGVVDEIDDVTKGRFRTLEAKLRFERKPEKFARYGMQVGISLLADPAESTLRIPVSALIRTGQGSRVVKALGGGHFQTQIVRLGRVNYEWAEIVSGLREGERIVVSGQFLLDSESSMRAELARMQKRSEVAP